MHAHADRIHATDLVRQPSWTTKALPPRMLPALGRRCYSTLFPRKGFVPDVCRIPPRRRPFPRTPPPTPDASPHHPHLPDRTSGAVARRLRRNIRPRPRGRAAVAAPGGRPPVSPFFSVFPPEPPLEFAPFDAVVGGSRGTSSALKVSYHPSQPLPIQDPMTRAARAGGGSAPKGAPAGCLG